MVYVFRRGRGWVSVLLAAMSAAVTVVLIRSKLLDEGDRRGLLYVDVLSTPACLLSGAPTSVRARVVEPRGWKAPCHDGPFREQGIVSVRTVPA